MVGRWTALLMAVALTGCAAPYIQPPLTPPAGFAGPRIEEPVRAGSPGVFVVQDGARLPFLRWGPESEHHVPEQPWAVLVAVHGMNDHNASFRLAGPWWAERGIVTYAFDQRGFGQAPGRGVWAGEPSMSEDLRTVTALVRARYPNAVLAVVGESMGGSVAASAFGSDRPPDADRVVLLAPGVWGWSSQGPVNGVGLWVAAHALGDLALEPPAFAVRDIVASDNHLELVRNGRDPESILATRFDTLFGLVDLMEVASRRLGLIRAPTLLMYGADDEVVRKPAMRRALQRAGSPANLRTAWYPDGHHLLNRDLGAETVYRDVEAYLRDASAPLPSGAEPVLPKLK